MLCQCLGYVFEYFLIRIFHYHFTDFQDICDRGRNRTGVPVGVYEPQGSSAELHGHKDPDGASQGAMRISVRLNPENLLTVIPMVFLTQGLSV